METEFVLSLGEQQWTLPPGADTFTIGRASNADIRLQADDQISRIHARLTRDDPATWTLHDESRNGTGLNGRRLTGPTPLNTGDRIHIGRSVLTFYKSTTPDTRPTPSKPAAPAPVEPAPTPPAAQAGPVRPAPGESEPAPSAHESAPAQPAPPPSAYESAPAQPAPGPTAGGTFADGAFAGGDSVQPGSPTGDRVEPSPFAGFSIDNPTNRAARDEYAAPHPGEGPANSADDAYIGQQPGQDGRGAYAGDSDDDASAGDGYTPDSAHPGQDAHAANPPHPAQDPHAANPARLGPNAQAANPPYPGQDAHAGNTPYPGQDAHAANTPYPGQGAEVGRSGYRGEDDYVGGDAYPGGSEFAGDGAFLGDEAYGDSGRGRDERGYSAGEAGDAEFGPGGIVPGFEDVRGGDGRTWAAYPSADNPEPMRSPWDVSGQIEHSEPNWNQSDSWPDSSGLDRRGADRRAGTDRRSPGGDRRASDRRTPGDQRLPGADQYPHDADQYGSDQYSADQYGADQRGAGLPGGDQRGARQPGGDQRGADRRGAGQRLTGSDQRAGADRHVAEFGGDAVGTVRLPRVLITAGGVILLGLIVNLIVTFFSDGPSGALRWLVPPGIALVVAMVLALLDAAAPKHALPDPPDVPDRRGRFDVSIVIAIAVVLVGVGVGGFAVTAGAKYVGGYLTGNESGADRLIKPVAKSGSGITMTVENVTYTSHFTRVEVAITNAGKEPFTIPIDGATFTAADGTALRADARRSAWPGKIAAGGTEHGSITFKGHLPDSATAAALTFKSGNTAFAVSGVTLSS